MRTYELAMLLIEQGKVSLDGLLTHSFPLERNKEALAVASDKREHQSVKVAFKF